MQNIFTIQYPDAHFDQSETLYELANTNIWSSEAWKVWPFFCGMAQKESEVDFVSQTDKETISVMRTYLLGYIMKNEGLDPELNQDIADVVRPFIRKNPQAAAELRTSILSFMTIVSLTLSASYVRLLMGEGAPMLYCLKTWRKEVRFVCSKDKDFHHKFKTEGLIGKNPKQLLDLFVRIAIATLITPAAVGGLLDATKWVASGQLTQEFLTQMEGLFMKYGNKIAKEMGLFFEAVEQEVENENV